MFKQEAEADARLEDHFGLDERAGEADLVPKGDVPSFRSRVLTQWRREADHMGDLEAERLTNSERREGAGREERVGAEPAGRHPGRQVKW